MTFLCGREVLVIFFFLSFFILWVVFEKLSPILSEWSNVAKFLKSISFTTILLVFCNYWTSLSLTKVEGVKSELFKREGSSHCMLLNLRAVSM